MGEDRDIDVRDDNSDESIGRPPKKKSRKCYILSTSEEKFISHLHCCLSMHLGFHAPINDDERCNCPFSITLKQKWHELIKFDSGLHHKFCSSNKKFGRSDLIPHINEKHNDRLGHGIAMYLRPLYGDAFGDGEFI